MYINEKDNDIPFVIIQHWPMYTKNVMLSRKLQKSYLLVTCDNDWQFKSFLIIINGSMIKTCKPHKEQ